MSSVEHNNSDEEAIDPEVECPVCMKLLVDATSTPCGHTFCRFCLEESFMRKSACPLCRLQISEEDCKDDRILRKMIERLYPQTMARRREELRRCVEDDDHEFWERKVKAIHNTLREGCENEEPNFVVWQNPSFPLPCPGEEEDIYFESPHLTSLVDSIYRSQKAGFILCPWDNRRSSATGDSAEFSDVGIFVRVSYYTLLSPSTSIGETSPNDEWVPSRLKLQRTRFRNNKIELYRDLRQSCVVKAKAIGRVKITNLICEDAECKGICLVSASAVCELNLPQRAEQVRVKALTLRNRILALRNDIGQAGRLLYNRRFGDLPAVPARCGISQLEDISFAFMIPLAIPAKHKNELIRSRNTEERMQSMLEMINASGTSLLRMRLTQSSSGDWLSRIFLGGWNQSLVLFFILAVGLAAVRWSEYGGKLWYRGVWL